ncbi:hypothetical protein [Candidatus Nitrosocosmicus franklandus]|uniref:hypothetical protein n=1 Tax=Candidatus Nitrosocosmicus franklandianus TaxID=1798806 RepID=UPI00106B37A3|nr:hypothetical protein [Candidatus Nitrosocosmicus franklandus]
MNRKNVLHGDGNSYISDVPIKKHLFLPSGNFIWEIRSKKDDYSYFIDSRKESCTCKGYYYHHSEKNRCYHFDKVTECESKPSYKIDIHHDTYYNEFLKKMVLEIVFRA